MLNRLLLIPQYLFYLFVSNNKHGVHSPFVYDFVTRVLPPLKKQPLLFHHIEHIRYKMLKSKAVVQMEDFGAKKKGIYDIPLSKMVKNSAKNAKYARLLYRICNYYKPEISLEMGTNVGVSTMYQAIAIPDGYLFSLEGSPSCVEISRYNLETLGLQNTQVIEGDFNLTLHKVLEQLPRLDYAFFDGNHSKEATLEYFNKCKVKAHQNTIFVFDDIHWSEGMKECWEEIKMDKAVTLSIDLFFMGIVFFRKENTEKEHFKIRF